MVVGMSVMGAIRFCMVGRRGQFTLALTIGRSILATIPFNMVDTIV